MNKKAIFLLGIMIFSIILFIQPIRANKTEISPFTINGNSAWQSLSESQPWCSGSGTEEDPYIIENIKINGGWSGSCLEIYSTSVYFIIRNSIFYNSGNTPDDAGIRLEDVSNGKIINNNCSNNERNGISLLGSEYNLIYQNTACDNYIGGIKLDDISQYNNITENILDRNANGVYMLDSPYNIISDNNINENRENGIFIGNSNPYLQSNDNRVSMNHISENNQNGIQIDRSDNVIVIDNIIIGNHQNGIRAGEVAYYTNISNNYLESNNVGIFVEESQYDNIIGNRIVDNNNYGVDVDSFSHYNLFFNNIFKLNGENARDNGESNYWDNGSIGNYWDDYIGVDDDDNGIGDTPYNILGSVNAKDNYPLINEPTNPEPALPPIDGYIIGISVVGIIVVIGMVIILKRKRIIFNF
jgi:parallel beta-helix repeat protein